MRITLLCKECHETEFLLVSEMGKVKFKCKNCGDIKNQLKIGNDEIYAPRCSCGGDVFKIRINKEEGSAIIQCKECNEIPEKKVLEEEPQVAITMAEISEENKSDDELKEIKSLLNELKNEIIRVKNRVEELERKSIIESQKVQEVKGDYYYLEHIIKKLKF
ncbi:MAG: hypothetical protein ACRC2K_10290 [Clostridium sp.]